MSWLYKYFRLVLGSTYPKLRLHDAVLELSGTGATLTLASGATVNEFSTDGTLGGNSDTAVPTEKAVKTYVDTNTTALKWKQSVVCATTANGTLATAYANGQSVDGVTLATGNRILIKDQSDQTVNGIYTVNATGAPTRAADADTASELLASIVPVEQGTVNADSAWVNTNDTITLGSTNITFSIFGGMKAGSGIAFTADVISIDQTTPVRVTVHSVAYNTPAMGVGVYGAGLADAIVGDNILVSFVSKSGVNKTSADTSSMTMYVGNSTTAAVTNNKMQGILSSMGIAHNVFDAYAGQFHINISATMATQAGNANLVGLACKANIATGATATGNVSALYVVLDTGTGDTATGTYDMIRMENNATQCDTAINFGDPTNMAALFNLGVAGCVTADTGTPGVATTHKIKIKIGGADGYIPVYADY